MADTRADNHYQFVRLQSPSEAHRSRQTSRDDRSEGDSYRKSKLDLNRQAHERRETRSQLARRSRSGFGGAASARGSSQRNRHLRARLDVETMGMEPSSGAALWA